MSRLSKDPGTLRLGHWIGGLLEHGPDVAGGTPVEEAKEAAPGLRIASMAWYSTAWGCGRVLHFALFDTRLRVYFKANHLRTTRLAGEDSQ